MSCVIFQRKWTYNITLLGRIMGRRLLCQLPFYGKLYIKLMPRKFYSCYMFVFVRTGMWLMVLLAAITTAAVGAVGVVDAAGVCLCVCWGSSKKAVPNRIKYLVHVALQTDTVLMLYIHILMQRHWRRIHGIAHAHTHIQPAIDIRKIFVEKVPLEIKWSYEASKQQQQNWKVVSAERHKQNVFRFWLCVCDKNWLLLLLKRIRPIKWQTFLYIMFLRLFVYLLLFFGYYKITSNHCLGCFIFYLTQSNELSTLCRSNRLLCSSHATIHTSFHTLQALNH